MALLGGDLKGFLAEMLSKDSHRGTLQALALGLKGRVSDCLATARRDAAPAGAGQLSLEEANALRQAANLSAS